MGKSSDNAKLISNLVHASATYGLIDLSMIGDLDGCKILNYKTTKENSDIKFEFEVIDKNNVSFKFILKQDDMC